MHALVFKRLLGHWGSFRRSIISGSATGTIVSKATATTGADQRSSSCNAKGRSFSRGGANNDLINPCFGMSGPETAGYKMFESLVHNQCA